MKKKIRVFDNYGQMIGENMTFMNLSHLVMNMVLFTSQLFWEIPYINNTADRLG